MKNFGLGTNCSWGENCLTVPATGYCVNSGAFNPNAPEYAFSLAFNITTLPTGAVVLISQSGQNNCRATANDRFSVYTASRVLYVAVKKNSGTTTSDVVTINTGVTLVANTNYVLDIVVKATSVEVYLNGQLVAENTSFTYTDFVSDVKVGLGCYCDTEGWKSSGQGVVNYYALNFYNRSLSIEEIETNLKVYNERFSLGL